MTNTTYATQPRDALLTQLAQEMMDRLNRNYLLMDEWDQISKKLGSLNARRCKERWEQLLDPNLNKAAFTKEENTLLLRKVKELGRRWAQIATFFKDRSPTQIKRQYGKLERSIANEARVILLAQLIKKQPVHDEAPPPPLKPLPKPLPLPQIFFRPSSNESTSERSEIMSEGEPEHEPELIEHEPEQVSSDGQEQVPFIVPVPEQDPFSEFEEEHQYLQKQWDLEMEAMNDPNWQYLPPMVNY